MDFSNPWTPRHNPIDPSKMLDRNKLILADISMDLKRVSVGKQRGSAHMAEVFMKEVVANLKQVNHKGLHRI